MAEKIAEYRKAIAALIVAPLLTFAVAIEDGTVSPAEWVYIALAALGVSTAVAAVPNKRPS